MGHLWGALFKLFATTNNATKNTPVYQHLTQSLMIIRNEFLE